MGGSNYNAAETMFPCLASFFDRNLGFVERCKLRRMNAFYKEMVTKLLSEHSRVTWTAGEVESLQSEISEFKILFRGHLGLTAHSVYLR